MLEDVDAIGITEDRESKQDDDKKDKTKKLCAVTLSGLLNAIGEFRLQNNVSFVVS